MKIKHKNNNQLCKRNICNECDFLRYKKEKEIDDKKVKRWIEILDGTNKRNSVSELKSTDFTYFDKRLNKNRLDNLNLPIE